MLLSDIGEGSSALYCLTDRTACCSTAAGGMRGLWNLSDGSDASGNAGFRVVRGYSSLILNRRSNTVEPTGVYTCLIPDSGAGNGITRSLQVMVDGMYKCMIWLDYLRLAVAYTCTVSNHKCQIWMNVLLVLRRTACVLPVPTHLVASPAPTVTRDMLEPHVLVSDIYSFVLQLSSI